MRKALLFFLSLVLMSLVGWSTVGADDGFYVIPAMRGNYAPVPKTGQTDSYGVAGSDGDLEKGVAWPTPRFTDNSNGTVTDNLTKLIWTKNANAFGALTWPGALSAAATLKNGTYDLTDGSQAGDWRLPNLRELQSLIDYGRFNPAFPAVHPFTNVQTAYHWSSTTHADTTTSAWDVSFYDGHVYQDDKSSNYNRVWCVRGGP